MPMILDGVQIVCMIMIPMESLSCSSCGTPSTTTTSSCAPSTTATAETTHRYGFGFRRRCNLTRRIGNRIGIRRENALDRTFTPQKIFIEKVLIPETTHEPRQRLMVIRL